MRNNLKVDIMSPEVDDVMPTKRGQCHATMTSRGLNITGNPSHSFHPLYIDKFINSETTRSVFSPQLSSVNVRMSKHDLCRTVIKCTQYDRHLLQLLYCRTHHGIQMLC